jgi:predicted phosphodiesterase
MTKHSFLSFSCPHHPLADPNAIDWLIDKIKEYKPDWIVCLGDMLEGNAASRWPNEYDWSLSDEFYIANVFMNRVRLAHPTARRIWIPGNHDNNIQKINRINKDLRDLCDWKSPERIPEIKNWIVPCDYVNDVKYGCWRLGQVCFSHGYSASVSSDEFQALKFGMPYGLFVCGHTHRPKRVTRCMKTKAQPLHHYYANAGCLRTLKPDYVETDDTQMWGHAIVVGEAMTWRYDNGYIPNTPQWEAQTIIYQMSQGYTEPSFGDIRERDLM